MTRDAKKLLREAETSAERSIGYVRCAIGASVAVFFFLVFAPTRNPGNPAVSLIPYFAAFSIGYVLVGIVTFILTRPAYFKWWTPWMFTTLDLCFWYGLLVATVLNIELPGNHIIVVPPALIVFIILALVALRNNPWLQIYALAFAVAAFLTLFLIAPDPVSGPLEGLSGQIGFFAMPLNVVRLSLVALTGAILIFLGVRTRRLLNRAIDETVQRTNLSRYLPPQLTGRLAQMDQDMLLAGTTRAAAILFVDLRGFTTMAESMDPKVLGEFLTQYRRLVSDQVHAHHGIVDKFVGDSVMAIFGAPDSTGNDAENALNCASGILRSINAWNRTRVQSGVGAVDIGIGVHWGRVFCGAIGDSDRLEFTVLGDAVNVAARLEQLTKDIGLPLIASESILAEADVRPTPETGWIAVKDSSVRGRREQLRLYARGQ